MYMVLKFISPELWPHLTTRVVLTFTVISQCVIWLKENGDLVSARKTVCTIKHARQHCCRRREKMSVNASLTDS